MRPKTWMLLLVILVSSTSYAFSLLVGPRFRDSNYDRVRRADAILLVLSRRLSSPSVGSMKIQDRSDFQPIDFQVLEVLKGDYENPYFTTQGNLNFRGRTEEDNFKSSRSGSTVGCVITVPSFRLHRLYVLFLAKDRGGAWFLTRLTRSMEEVDSVHSPWVEAVRHYAAIAKLDDYELEKRALLQLASRSASGMNGSKYPLALARDIRFHLSNPTPQKSYADLEEMFFSAKDMELKRQVIWSFWIGQHPEALPLVRWVLSQPPNELTNFAAEYLNAVGDTESIPRIAEILFNNFHRQGGLAGLMARLAGPSEKDLMLRILSEAPPQVAAQAVSWFYKHPTEEALPHLRRLVLVGYGSYNDLAKNLAAQGDTVTIDWAVKELQKGDIGRSWPAAEALAAVSGTDERVLEILKSGGHSARILAEALLIEGKGALLEKAGYQLSSQD